MAVLGIITCETLELEIAWLLANDPDITGVTVLEDSTSGRLIRALESRRVRNVRCVPHVNSFRPEPSRHPEVLVRVLDLSLHGKRNTLRRAVASAAREMAPRVDSLLLGYGLCGNAFDDLQMLLDVDVPVFIPMDDDRPVDDCVGLLLGGRDCYHAEQRKVAGTFFMTPGWAWHWRKMFNRDFCGNAPGKVKRIFAGYRRSLLVVTPVMGEDEMKRNVDEFNGMLGFVCEARRGTMELLTRAWQSAKSSLFVHNQGLSKAL